MAQRARPSRGAGRGETRKPVTIDLEANPAGEKADKAGETGKTEPKTDKLRGAEPVAMDKANRTAADTNDSPPKADDAKDGTPSAETKDGEPWGRKDEAAEAPAAPPPSPARRGGIGAIAAGVIGGVIALLGGAGLQWAGVLPAPGGQAETVDLTPMETQIGQLQVRLDELAGGSEISAELVGQVTAAVQGAESAQSSIATLSDEISALQAAIASGQAGEGAGLEALSGRLDAVEQQMAGVAEQLAAIDGANAAIDGLGADMDAIRGSVDGLAGRVDALETGLSDAQGQLAEGGADSSIVARAIAAAGLKSAIDRGATFMAELEAYASVAGEDETVTTLRDFAASGVPTVTQLADGFGTVANRIVATGQGLDENASIGDRLMASARGLVQVRPVGEAEGDTPGAIAARIETRLKAGDLSAALAEWEMLPEAAQAASTDFMDRVRARQTVDQLVAGALNTAMSAAQPAASQ